MLQWIGGCIYIYFELVFLFSFNKYHKENCKKKKGKNRPADRGYQGGGAK